MRLVKDPASSTPQLIVDEKPLSIGDLDLLLFEIIGYGHKEAGHDIYIQKKEDLRVIEWVIFSQFRFP